MRIKVIDGLRAVAVLGVLWAHIWLFLGNPSFIFMKADLAKIMSLMGVGVDLFFVISGFCMYLMYTTKKNVFSFNYYRSYLFKRWLRIAPAFYASVLIYGMLQVKFNVSLFDWGYALQHIFFIKNYFVEKTLYGPHFWSLGTEWHFYMVLPLIMAGINKWSFNICVALMITFCLLFRIVVWTINDDPNHIILFSIPNRLIEFIIGMVAAKLYVSGNRRLLFNSMTGLVTGAIIALSGRLLMAGSMVYDNKLPGIISRVVDIPLLTLGFGIIMINLLQKRSWVTSFLESRFMISVGKYSYSMYLWHWVISAAVTVFIRDHFSMNPFLMVNLSFILSVLLLYPVSKLSYNLFEAVYFRRVKAVSY